MVPFAGYEMPVQYPAGILKEHLHTREKAGLFDVSHMGQAFLSGADPAKALERVTPADVDRPEGRHAALRPAAERCRARSRTISCSRGWPARRDSIWSSMPARRKAISPISREKLKGAATLTPRPDRALLALQGPLAGDGAGAPFARHRQAHLHEGRARHRRRRARHRQPHRLYRRGRLRDFHRRRAMPSASPARCWAKPKCCPSVLARATACGWKRGFASTAMTSTRPPIRSKPI